MAADEKQKETVEKVKQIIAEQLGVEEAEVTPSASFVDDLGADSLDTVELVMALEENFDIEIPDDAAEKIRTVQDAIDYIEKHRAGSWSGEKLTQRVQHAITNVLFEVDGDTAWGETYVEVRRMPPGQLFVEGVARQIDRFERRNGEWRIAHRRIVLEYVGAPPRDM